MNKPDDECDNDYDEFRERDDYDDYGEPCGCCDECEGDLYADDTWFDDEGFQYCGQCWWMITGGIGSQS